MTLLKYAQKDNLHYYIFDTRENMGMAAALCAQFKMQELLKQKIISVIFASAPSQNETLDNVAKLSFPWEKIIGFHMDEYIGLPENAEQSFSHYIKQRLIQHIPIKEMHYIRAHAKAEEEIQRYAELLQQFPVDLIFLGIGENGHIAFNDPHVADFNDAQIVKKVTLDEECRMQQVNDGCFAQLSHVPEEALTLTIPTLCSAKYMICTVPGATKRQAVTQMINGAIEEALPASILRKHENAYLFLDKESARDLL